MYGECCPFIGRLFSCFSSCGPAFRHMRSFCARAPLVSTQCPKSYRWLRACRLSFRNVHGLPRIYPEQRVPAVTPLKPHPTTAATAASPVDCRNSADHASSPRSPVRRTVELAVLHMQSNWAPLPREHRGSWCLRLNLKMLSYCHTVRWLIDTPDSIRNPVLRTALYIQLNLRCRTHPRQPR
jgi:hypothetical protein